MKGTPITEQLFNYIVANFAQEDDLLRSLPAEAERRGVPLINISPEQGKFLQVLMRIASATRVLEIGSLFGYSTIWLARAVPEGGKLIALEVHPLHAQLTRENVARAGLADRVEVRQGNALELLAELDGEGPFDLAFIDADKPNYVAYLEHALRLVRKGGVIVGDNASARGNVWMVDADSDAEFINSVRAFNERMATDPHLLSILVPISDGMCVGVVQ
jgi:predicted O-methyltransferase YrrM